MIEVSNLHKSFEEQQVLKGISVSVPRGKTLVILGLSGSGKSVLLKCIVGLIKPEQGSIRVDGKEVTSISQLKLDALRRRIGYVFQNAALYDSMTVEENLAFHLVRHRKVSADERAAVIREKLAFVGMEKALNKYPSELSGGMQKRVGLARALVLSPKIVLYDEPTTGLDPITAAEIDGLILRLKQETGVTAISITHSLESAARTADEIAVLHAGRFVATGTFAELLQCDEPFVKDYFDHLHKTVEVGARTIPADLNL